MPITRTELPEGKIDIEHSPQEAAVFFRQLVSMCGYSHRVREMLAHIRRHARADFEAFGREPRRVGDTSRGWTGARGIEDFQIRFLRDYRRWARSPKRTYKLGEHLTKFCTWYNRQREDDRIVRPYLEYRATKRGESRAQARESAAQEMRRLNGSTRAAASERRLLLTKAGARLSRPLDATQLRRALEKYRTSKQFRAAVDKR